MKIFSRFLVEITLVAVLPFPLTSYSCVTRLSYVEAAVVATFPSASSVRAVTSVIDTRRVCSVTRSEDESCGLVTRVNASPFVVHCTIVFVAVDLPFAKPFDGFWVVGVLGFLVAVIFLVVAVVIAAVLVVVGFVVVVVCSVLVVVGAMVVVVGFVVIVVCSVVAVVGAMVIVVGFVVVVVCSVVVVVGSIVVVVGFVVVVVCSVVVVVGAVVTVVVVGF